MIESVADSALFSIAPGEFRIFRELICRHTGIWLRDGKEVMLASRLSRRLRHHRLSNFTEYYRYLETCDDPGAELGELINCVTTNKTAFFRERHHFAFLSETALPQILRARANGPLAPRTTLQIWSAACSSGEEPYSIAIALLEAHLRGLAGAVGSWDARILASDIDTTVLATAARGIYSGEEIEEIDAELLRKYFLRGRHEMTGCFKVKPQVRSLVDFQRINLMDSSWPLNTLFDIVFLRNALIYFKRETQDLVLRRIVRHLKPGGYLMLGHSEHIPWLHDILEPLQQTVYRVRTGQP